MSELLTTQEGMRSLREVRVGKDVTIRSFVNAYECEIGDGSSVGTFVEIQRGVKIGRRCKVQSHSFLCEGVTIEDQVFIGHGVMFTNDRFPRATAANGQTLKVGEWKLETTYVGRYVSIGTGAIILPGIKIGEGAVIGAGAIVTRDVPAWKIVAGIPARVMRELAREELAEFEN